MGELAWDLECEVGFRQDEPMDDYLRRAGVAIACVIDLATGQPSFYSPGDENGFGLLALAERLESADLVVSYNGERFDNHVLGWAIGRMGPIQLKRSIDVCGSIFKSLNGIRYPRGSWKLKRVAKDTIGMTKLDTEGASAPEMWKNKRFGEVVSYCHQDVRVLAHLYKHIQRSGYVLDPNGQAIEVRLG